MFSSGTHNTPGNRRSQRPGSLADNGQQALPAHIRRTMNALPFIKMHGLGNDFVVLDAREAEIGLTPQIVRAIGDRRRGWDLISC